MKRAVKMMIAAMLCGVVMTACGGGGYTGTYAFEVEGKSIGVILNADGTASSFSGDTKEDGFFWEAGEKDGKVFIIYGEKDSDGKIDDNGGGFFYEDGKLVNDLVTLTKQ